MAQTWLSLVSIIVPISLYSCSNLNQASLRAFFKAQPRILYIFILELPLYKAGRLDQPEQGICSVDIWFGGAIKVNFALRVLRFHLLWHFRASAQVPHYMLRISEYHSVAIFDCETSSLPCLRRSTHSQSLRVGMLIVGDCRYSQGYTIVSPVFVKVSFNPIFGCSSAHTIPILNFQIIRSRLWVALEFEGDEWHIQI